MTTLYLADTSAYTIARRIPAAESRLRRLANGVLAMFVTVDLGLGYSARDPGEHQGIFRVRGQLVQLACTDEIAGRARQVQALLATTSQHRAAGVMDLLTAAAAEHCGASVLQLRRRLRPHRRCDSQYPRMETDEPARGPGDVEDEQDRREAAGRPGRGPQPLPAPRE